MAAKKRKTPSGSQRRTERAKAAAKKKKKNEKSSKPKVRGPTSVHGILRASEFVEAVIAHVHGAGTSDRWPGQRADPKVTSDEFAAMAHVLLLVYHEQDLPTGLPATAARLAEFLASRDWPNTYQLPPLPAKYKKVPIPVQKLVQVSTILDGLLALVSGDHPGGPKEWPVHP